MAVKVNGALIVEQKYVWGIDNGTEVIPCWNYKIASSISEATGRPLKMCVHYITEWMEAQ